MVLPNPILHVIAFNQFVPSVPFLYLMKTSENRRRFQGVEKGCTESEWVNPIHLFNLQKKLTQQSNSTHCYFLPMSLNVSLL